MCVAIIYKQNQSTNLLADVLSKNIVIKMKRNYQATLFGNIVSKSLEYVSNPTNVFERFMNKYFELNADTGRNKKKLTDDGIKMWKKYKGTYLL